MSVSIVIPCYNEQDIIDEVVRSYYTEVVSKIDDSELIVVDDCSQDNTNNILKKLEMEFPRLRVIETSVNSGHGKAIRMGYELARKDYVFQVDSDNQFRPREFWKLYEFKNNYDFVLGFRWPRHDTLLRLVLTRIIGGVNFVLFGVWLKDANCPFRLIKKSVLDKLIAHIDGEALAPNIMLSILAKLRGIRIKEVPVIHYRRKTGTVSIANWKLIKFALKGFRQLVLFRISL